jgi:hypothetical protein
MEHLQDHENGKYILVPKSVSEMETVRCCPPLKRLKEGSVYLVDALTAKITDEFMRNVAKKKPKTIEDGEELFKETVNDVNQNYVKWAKTVIHSTLKNKAGIRGELVLFKKIKRRYPIFEKRPRASFLGVLRVNGEKLVEEIKTWYTKGGKYIPLLPYCGKKGRWKLPEFASKFGLTKAFARRVLKNYRSTLYDLPVGDALIFSGVGEFIMTDDGLQFKPYQHTCLK